MDNDDDLTVEQFLEKHKGEDFPVDDNICECASMTVGENRCSCGNRRVEILKEEWGFYAEPY
jgi:hypothetical protein